jgi:hypothetical protein
MKEMVLYNNVKDPMEMVEKIGSALSRSGMFGIRSEEQGMILAMACMAEQKSPIEICQKYHIIEDRKNGTFQLTRRADSIHFISEPRGLRGNGFIR